MMATKNNSVLQKQSKKRGRPVLATYMASINARSFPEIDLLVESGKDTSLKLKTRPKTTARFHLINQNLFNKRLQKASSKIENALTSGLEFSALEMENSELVELCVEMLLRSIAPVLNADLINHPDTQGNLITSLHDLVGLVEEIYTNTTFDNFRRACDRMQLMYSLVTEFVTSKLEPDSIFALLFLSLCLNIGSPYGANINMLHENGLLEQFDSVGSLHIKEIYKLVTSHPVFTNFVDAKYCAKLLSLSVELISSDTIVAPYDFAVDVNICRKSLISEDVDDKMYLETKQLAVLMQTCELSVVFRSHKSLKDWSSKKMTEIKAKELAEQVWKHEECKDIDFDEFEDRLFNAQSFIKEEDSRKGESHVGYFNKDFFQQKVRPIVSQGLFCVDKRVAVTLSRRVDLNKRLLNL